MMKENHIKVIISLLEKHGRDPKASGGILNCLFLLIRLLFNRSWMSSAHSALEMELRSGVPKIIFATICFREETSCCKQC